MSKTTALFIVCAFVGFVLLTMMTIRIDRNTRVVFIPYPEKASDIDAEKVTVQ